MTGLSRRSFVIGGASLLALGACADDEDDTASGSSSQPGTSASPSASAVADGPWEYTDDLGETITLDKRPERILAYAASAAVLWDLGIQVDATMGTVKNADGTAAKSSGRIDLSKITEVGEEEVDLEKVAALRPDIIVLQKNSEGLDAYPLTDEQLDAARKIAPFVAVTAFGAGADKVIEAYERLATALGSDQSAPDLVREKDRLTAAQDKLRSTLEGKDGLRAMFVSAGEDQLYVAKTEDFPDMIAYSDLGLDIVEAGGDETYFETLSWENADTYDVDLILVDEREGNLQPDTLKADQPTWRSLPAVEADQVGGWNAEVVFSPRGFADAVEALTAVIENADPALVS